MPLDAGFTGQLSYQKGLVAEGIVADAYRRNGFDVAHQRFKVREGEIDLIARHGKKLYFVEVKASRSFDRAVEQVTARQKRRVMDAALRYLAQECGSLDVECRFDVALVDGTGRVRVIPDAFRDE